MMDTTTLMKSIWMILSYTLYTLKLYIQMTTLFAGFVSVYQESKIWNTQHHQQQQQQHLNNNNNNKDKNDDQQQNLIRIVQPLSLYGSCKVFMLNVVWMSFCLSGSILILMRHIILLGNTDIAYESNQWIEKTCAKIVTHLFLGRVIVTGIEHLPPPPIEQEEEDPSTTSSSSSSTTRSKSKPAPVYIANHTSQVDAAVTYFIDRRYKWIAKQSVMYLPGVGQIMYLSDHIFISRKKGGHHHHHQNNNNNKQHSSIVSLFEKSNESIQNGMPIFFFPEGTRHIQRTIFKDGAFIVAQTNKSSIIPISIDVPYNVWNSSYPFISTTNSTNSTTNSTTTTPSDSSCSQQKQQQQQVPIIKITIHPPISVTGEEDREALKKKCGDIIYSVIPTTTSTTTTTTTTTTIVGEKKKDK